MQIKCDGFLAIRALENIIEMSTCGADVAHHMNKVHTCRTIRDACD